jgi:hypothetical protein
MTGLKHFVWDENLTPEPLTFGSFGNQKQFQFQLVFFDKDLGLCSSTALCSTPALARFAIIFIYVGCSPWFWKSVDA